MPWKGRSNEHTRSSNTEQEQAAVIRIRTASSESFDKSWTLSLRRSEIGQHTRSMPSQYAVRTAGDLENAAKANDARRFG